MSEFDQTRDRFREAVGGPSGDVPLARCALLIAQSSHWRRDAAAVLSPTFGRDIDIDAYERRIDDMASVLRKRLDGGMDVAARVATANRWLFGELGFRGNERDYDDPRNLLLDEVLERRLGIPVTLALIYIEVCQRAGLSVAAVGLPGHVVARIDDPAGEPIFADVFHGGRQLTPDDCRALVRRVYGRRTPVRDWYLSAITPRQLLQRLLHNIKSRAQQRGDDEDAGRAIDLLLALFPWDLDELRDRGMLRERIGDYPAALADLERYARYRADAKDIESIAEAVRSLRRHTAADSA